MLLLISFKNSLSFSKVVAVILVSRKVFIKEDLQKLIQDIRIYDFDKEAKTRLTWQHFASIRLNLSAMLSKP